MHALAAVVLASLLATPVLAVESAADGHWRFAVVGDTRDGDRAHRKLVAALAGEPGLALLINTGDLVNSGERDDEWQRFFEIAQPLLARMPLYPALGNHDLDADRRSQAGWQRWIVHRRGPARASPAGTALAFERGNVLFLVLDDMLDMGPDPAASARRPADAPTISAAQRAFVETELARADRDPRIQHRIAVVHAGPYSSIAQRSGSAALRGLLPLLRSHGVNLLISGHDHHYAHGVDAGGLHYVVSGGGGAPLYEVAATPQPQPEAGRLLKGESVHHYLVVDVAGAKLTVTVRRHDGSLLERFTIDAPPSLAAPAQSAPGRTSTQPAASAPAR